MLDIVDLCELNLKAQIDEEEERVIKCVLSLANLIRSSMMLKGKGVKIDKEKWDRAMRHQVEGSIQGQTFQ